MGGFFVMLVEAEDFFFGGEPGKVEAEECQRKEEELETGFLFRGAVAMVAVRCGLVAVDAPGYKVKNTAEHHAADGDAEEEAVILINKLIQGVSGQHTRQTNGGAKADKRHSRRNTAAENVRQNRERTDKACGGAEFVGVHGFHM